MISDNTENNCFICWNPLTNEYGKKIIVHKYDKENKNSEKWQHSCHEKCLNNWSKQCITVGEGVYPKCPVCNSFEIPINKIPKSLRVRAIEILEAEAEEVEEYEEAEEVIEDEVEQETQEVVEAIHRLGVVRACNSIAPFLGILVCFNGFPIIKCSNITFNYLSINSSIRDLKAALLSKNVEFYKSKGLLHFDNLAHNLNIKNWINWKYPSFRLSEIHYGIPPYTCSFEQLNCTHNFNDDNIPLSELYFEYQTKAGLIMNGGPNLINNERTPHAYKKLEDIYLKKNIWHHGSTGPDDPGYIEMAYRNNENPWFPDSKLFKNGHYGQNVTWDSLMWLTVHIDNV
jgi:hypothetical protein